MVSGLLLISYRSASFHALFLMLSRAQKGIRSALWTTLSFPALPKQRQTYVATDAFSVGHKATRSTMGHVKSSSAGEHRKRYQPHRQR